MIRAGRFGRLPLLAGLSVLTSLFVFGTSRSAAPSPGSLAVSNRPSATISSLDSRFGKVPLVFEPNVGQADPQVRFVARGGGLTVFFTGTESIMVLSQASARNHGKTERAAVRMQLVGGHDAMRVHGMEKQPGVSNYFLGGDPSRWRTGVPHYGRVRYQSVYPGIDLVWYGNERKLEYDFVVGPGVDPEQIQVAYQGAQSMDLEANGDLVLRTALGEVRQPRPRVYQEIAGKQVDVGARYSILARNRVGFELAQYDRRRELRIDPMVLLSSRTVGGSGEDQGSAIAVDNAGSAYITGFAMSTDLPTPNGYMTAFQGGGEDAFVTKLTPDGQSVAYTTYLGGSANDRGAGIAVDATGSAYITGYTLSTNFPTLSAYQPANKGGGDAFIAKLTASGGALVYSTYLGGSGSDRATGLALDTTGSAYVTGTTSSADFPTVSAYQAAFQGGSSDAFVAKLAPAGNSLVYSTYLGGNNTDVAAAIAIDGTGSAYITGHTASAGFPTQSAFQAYFQGGPSDAFITKLAPAGNTLAYSTFLGGIDADAAVGIAVDAAGSAYVTGDTSSTDFPMQVTVPPGMPGEVFVTKLQPTGASPVYSTKLDRQTPYGASGIAVDGAGFAYIVGTADLSGWPPPGMVVVDDINAYITKLSPSGVSPGQYAYLGGMSEDGAAGIAVDAAGVAYVTGWTSSPDFPQTNGGASSEAYVARVRLIPPPDWVGLFQAGTWKFAAKGAAGTVAQVSWGDSSSKPVAGDWNGDGKTKVGVYINGVWYLDYNGDGVFDSGDKAIAWGWSDSVPVVGDWNGDGKTKIGVYHQGVWYLDYNGNGTFDAGDQAVAWGWPTDKPVVGDWNGNGKSKIGVYHEGIWYLDVNGNGAFDASDRAYAWGWASSTPLVGDWNGDGKAETGVYHNGIWYLDANGDGTFSADDKIVAWGDATGKPVVGDWNGDGKTKIGVVLGNIWYLDVDGSGTWSPSDKAFLWGQASDKPLIGNW